MNCFFIGTTTIKILIAGMEMLRRWALNRVQCFYSVLNADELGDATDSFQDKGNSKKGEISFNGKQNLLFGKLVQSSRAKRYKTHKKREMENLKIL